MDRQSESPRAKIAAVIPAAGFGTRMGLSRAKQFLDLNGRPMLAVTVGSFQASAAIDEIILVVPAEELGFCRKEIVERHGFTKVKKVVAGGRRRQDSVRAGIEATGGDFDLILIHDGVRPLVGADLIQKMADAAGKYRAAVAGLPAKDTVKEVGEDGLVLKTYDRSRVRLIQTPQIFRYQDILAAHRGAMDGQCRDATDDALMVERMGIPVKVVTGSEYNIKVTTPWDLELARFLLRRLTALR